MRLDLNPFWRNTWTEKHRPDPDPLNTDVSPTPAAPARRKTVCEFCDCHLAPDGSIISVGEKAKGFRRHEETLEKKDKEITRLTEELTAARRELADLKAASAGSSSRIGFEL